MKRAVIDASVITKLFFEEEHSGIADQFFTQCEDPLTPDFVWTEVANVIWKRCRRGELSRANALAIFQQARGLPLQAFSSADLLLEALELATQFDRSVYDCLYLALALQTNSVLVSGDRRFVNALASGPMGRHIAWIGDLKRI